MGRVLSQASPVVMSTRGSRCRCTWAWRRRLLCELGSPLTLKLQLFPVQAGNRCFLARLAVRGQQSEEGENWAATTVAAAATRQPGVTYAVSGFGARAACPQPLWPQRPVILLSATPGSTSMCAFAFTNLVNFWIRDSALLLQYLNSQ